MRYAILGDIHSNLAAFEAVLGALEDEGGFDRIWCLGDIVGYGPDPHECIALLRSYNHVCVAGNHDLAAVHKIDTSDFNHDAARANQWTSLQLSEDDKEYLQSLPLQLIEDDFTIVHGSPRYPVWEYLFTFDAVQDNFEYFDTRYCLVGHSHAAMYFEYVDGLAVYKDFSEDARLPLGGNRLIVNPGGVGQPRDGDPRASYAVYDSEENVIHHYREEYDIVGTQKKMKQCGLPEFLINRLSIGR
jgi:diadenosine tetraphosphatase ApaH/serine/threonine PP2A family protein phosphatase